MTGIIKQILFNIYCWFLFVLITLTFFIFLPLFLLITVVFLGKAVDFSVRRAIMSYGWIFTTIVPFLAPVRVESRYTEKPSFPAILVANHNSAFDPFLFAVLLIDAGCISTWPFKIPAFGFLMRLAKYINANEGWETIVAKSAALLKSGASIVIWPEGHRSRDGRLGRFRNGAFALAVKTGYPLLPVCIIGAEKFLPPGKRLMSPSRIKLILLDPIYPDPNMNHEEEIIRLRKCARDVIQKTLGEA